VTSTAMGLGGPGVTLFAELTVYLGSGRRHLRRRSHRQAGVSARGMADFHNGRLKTLTVTTSMAAFIPAQVERWRDRAGSSRGDGTFSHVSKSNRSDASIVRVRGWC